MRNQAVKMGCILSLLLFAAGCSTWSIDKSQDTPPSQNPEDQIVQLRQVLTEKQNQVEKLQEELVILLGFPADRLEQLVHVSKIEFGRYTQSYDNNEDGVDDGINVYLVLRDRQGDKIKASGAVEIELWDLSAGEGKRFLKRHQYGLEELSGQWLGGFLSDHYKFQVDLDEEHRPINRHLTLKLHFNDALTGKGFETQKLIQVKIARDRERVTQ